MTNIATREEMRQEAQSRLEILTAMGLYPLVLKNFKSPAMGIYDRYYTENMPYGLSTLYWLGQDETDEGGTKMVDLIGEFEDKHNAYVYHASHLKVIFGSYGEAFELIDLFYVSQYKEEWEDDREKLREGLSCVYSMNRTDEHLSEFGWVEFHFPAGGLCRRLN